jgi:hypothetical protein
MDRFAVRSFLRLHNLLDVFHALVHRSCAQITAVHFFNEWFNSKIVHQPKRKISDCGIYPLVDRSFNTHRVAKRFTIPGSCRLQVGFRLLTKRPFSQYDLVESLLRVGSGILHELCFAGNGESIAPEVGQ